MLPKLHIEWVRTWTLAMLEMQAACGLFSGGPITILTDRLLGVADWPYDHRLGGEQTGYIPIPAQLFWSNLPQRAADYRGDDE